MRWIPLNFFFRHLVSDIPLEEVVDEVRDFDERFMLIIRKHMAVLGMWCLLHLMGGTIGLLLAEGAWWYFWLMSMCWAFVNLLVVYWIFDHVFLEQFKSGNLFQRFDLQRHIEKMLFANIGLDVAYIFCGLFFFALAGQSDIPYPELWRGFAWAVLLQGAYLFLQDIFFHRLHYANFKKSKA
ncbi:MAG: hypothetical protein AAFO94_21275, partial [Bacteroidota bacterium]